MVDLVCIDGNNLLHAMHADAPIPNVGRETLVKIIERWAKPIGGEVLLVFDGPQPRSGLALQMASQIVTVRFSEKRSADDVLVDQIHAAKNPERIRIVTSDGAILKEARYRRCQTTQSQEFVAELFPQDNHPTGDKTKPPEKPNRNTPEETRQWLDTFGFDQEDKEAFDGFDAMKP